jgi:hypothetical protein
MKAGLLRQGVPPNGGAIIDRRWVDERGNPSSCCVAVWVGQPFGPGEGGFGGENREQA